MTDDVDFRLLASKTEGSSGADLENLCREVTEQSRGEPVDANVKLDIALIVLCSSTTFSFLLRFFPGSTAGFDRWQGRCWDGSL